LSSELHAHNTAAAGHAHRILLPMRCHILFDNEIRLYRRWILDCGMVIRNRKSIHYDAVTPKFHYSYFFSDMLVGLHVQSCT